MKLKKLWLGLAVTFGVLLAGNQQVQADSHIVTFDDVVSSGGFPVKLYADSNCTTNIGTLNPNITEWRTFRAVSNTKGTSTSFELGANQWVKSNDVFLGGVNRVTNENPLAFNFAYSAYKQVPIYDSPQLTNVTGYLSEAMNAWKITGYALHTKVATVIDVIDLGNNQWVSTKDVPVIKLYSFFAKDTQLYNQSGQPTTRLAEGTYKIFAATSINDETYVKLGTDNQWTKLASAMN